MAYDEGKAQRMAQKQATAWLDKHAERLGLTPADILSAITRGHRTEDIASMPATEVERLKGSPISQSMAVAIGRMKNATILPLPRGRSG